MCVYFWCEKYRENAQRRPFDQTSALRRYDGNRVSSDGRVVKRKHVVGLHTKNALVRNILTTVISSSTITTTLRQNISFHYFKIKYHSRLTF